MAPKKSSLKSLKKGVNAKKASSVKGGMIKLKREKLAANHNQVVRA
jgi:hypothetical protein